MEDEQEIKLQQSPPKLEEKRVCPKCFKEFSSGKALGGHMSCHVQDKKKQQIERQELKLKKQTSVFIDDGDDDGKEKPSCPICSKNFPSRKSLFGHMRCHPERGWRGIEPPKKSTVPAPVIDLPKWAVKARRGREAIIRDSSRDLSLEEEAEKMAGCVVPLMLLGHVDNFPRSLNQDVNNHNRENFQGFEKKRRQSLMEEEDRDYCPKRPMIEGRRRGISAYEVGERSNTSNSLMDKGKGKVEDPTSDSHEESDSCNWASMIMDNGNSNVGLVIQESKVENEKKRKHICSVCNKGFLSYQALGGHMSYHKTKFKLTIIDASPNKVLDHHNYEELEHRSIIQTEDRLTDVPIKYQCTICNKTFSSGQALGGHKRCHWAAPVELGASAVAGQAPPSQVTSPTEEETSGTQTTAATSQRTAYQSEPPMLFDLNEPPPREDNDVQGEGADGIQLNFAA